MRPMTNTETTKNYATIASGHGKVRLAVGQFPTRQDFVVDILRGPRKVPVRSCLDGEILRFDTREDAARFLSNPSADSIEWTMEQDTAANRKGR
jgi:hypothetical protein